MPRVRLALALLLLFARGAFAATPVLVKDLDPRLVRPEGLGLAAGQFLSLGGLAVYAVRDQISGDRADELWGSDGTLGGTRRLFTANGEAHTITLLDAAGRVGFFTASFYDGSQIQARLFRTDGTAEGTFELDGVDARHLFHWTSRAGLFYFVVDDPATGSELWRSDGSPAGTLLLRDITPGIYGSNPRAFLSTADRLWFFADSPDGVGLWSTDGSRAGTRRAALLPPYSQPVGMMAAGSRIFFTEGGGSIPLFNLWTSDGTQAGTVPVPPFHRQHRKGPAVSGFLGSLGGQLVFLAEDSRSRTAQLWISDGSVAGTRLLTDFGEGLDSLGGSVVIREEQLLFVGPGSRLWTTRGTRASTRPLLPCRRKDCARVYLTAPLFRLGERALFIGDQDYEPWVTDGTAEGTRRLVDTVPGPNGSFPSFVPGPAGTAFFYAQPDSLWITDGTSEGTHVTSRSAMMPPYYSPVLLALAGERAIFAGFNAEGVQEVRSTDGSLEGTAILASLSHGADSLPQSLRPFQDGVLFYTCVDQTLALWRSDGTAEGTTQLVAGGLISCSDPNANPLLMTVGDTAWFASVSPDEYWYELWKSDGTAEGTGPVNDGNETLTLGAVARDGDRIVFTMQDYVRNVAHFQAIPVGGGAIQDLFELSARFVSNLTALDGELFFVADSPGDFYYNLWRSDGTPEGTRALARVDLYWPGFAGFFRIDGDVFFLNPLSLDPGLFRTDGTPEGTRRTVPYIGGTTPTELSGLALFGGRLFFIGNRDYEYPPHRGLYRSDGTAVGTALLAPLGVNNYDPDPGFTEAAGLLFFVAPTEEQGTELWRTDGTRAGTFVVRDINPGPSPSGIFGLTAAAGRVWFAADDGEHGAELWSSDGTAAGTRLEADVAEGQASSYPSNLAAAGGRLFFSADDGVTGRELWLLPLDEQGSRP
jgi:ELWxxDGT repeat protein